MSEENDLSALRQNRSNLFNARLINAGQTFALWSLAAWFYVTRRDFQMSQWTVYSVGLTLVYAAVILWSWRRYSRRITVRDFLKDYEKSVEAQLCNRKLLAGKTLCAQDEAGNLVNLDVTGTGQFYPRCREMTLTTSKEKISDVIT